MPNKQNPKMKTTLSGATREYYFNKIRENIRKDLEKNENNPNKKEEMAKNCRDYKKQLDKFKAEEDKKKDEKAN